MAIEATRESVALRLRRLQSVVRELDLDALLLVPGVDGCDNAGSHQAIAYLFQGASGREVLDATSVPAAFEDMFVLVRPSGLDLYCTSAAHGRLWPLLAGLDASLVVHCPTAEEEDDPDALEIAKVGALVHALRGMRRLGLTLTPVPQQRPDGSTALGPGSPMEAEKWPLVAAYGLDGVGRPGFLTMLFDVVDVSGALWEEYCRMDAHAVRAFVEERAAALDRCWAGMCGALAGCAPSQRGALTEADVAEPLASYFQFGVLRLPAGVRRSVTMAPKVLFGPRAADPKAKSSGEVTVASQGTADGGPCTHFVAEAADPHSALRVARTYLLSQPYPGDGVRGCRHAACVDAACEAAWALDDPTMDFEEAQWAQRVAPSLGGAAARASRVAALYAGVVAGAQAALAAYARTAQDGGDGPDAGKQAARAARDAAAAAAVARAQDLGVPADVARNAAAGLRIALWASDHANRVEVAPACAADGRMRVLRVETRVPAADIGPGSADVALVYGDTFLLVADPDAAGACVVLNVTEQIPPLAAWDVHPWAARAEEKLRSVVEKRTARDRPSAHRQGSARGPRARDSEDSGEEGSEAAPHADGALAAFGEPAFNYGEPCVLLFDAREVPAVPGRLHCYREGLLFEPERTVSSAPMVLPLHPSAVEAVHVDWGSAEDDDAAFAVGPTVTLRTTDPRGCGLPIVDAVAAGRTVKIALGAMSSYARKRMRHDVVPDWDIRCGGQGIPFLQSTAPAEDGQGVEAGSGTLARLHAAAVRGADAGQHGPAVSHERLAELLRHMDALELAEPDSGPESPPLQPLVDLVIGAPGCRAADVADTVVRMTRTSAAWTQASRDLLAAEDTAADSSPLETLPRHFLLSRVVPAVRAAVQRNDAVSEADGPPPSHVLVSAVGSDSMEVTLAALREALTGVQWQLGTVTVCLRADDAVECPPRRQPSPAAVALLRPGLVDHVVVLGAGSSGAPGRAGDAAIALATELVPGASVVRGGASLAAGAARLLRRTRPGPPERALALADAAVAGGVVRTAPRGACRGVVGDWVAHRVRFDGSIDLRNAEAALRRAAALARADATAAPPLTELDEGGCARERLAGICGTFVVPAWPDAGDMDAGRSEGTASAGTSDAPLLRADTGVDIGSGPVTVSATVGANLGAYLVATGAAPTSACGGELVMWGQGLRRSTCERIVTQMAPPPPERLPDRLAGGFAAGAASLTADERAMLAVEARDEPLPAGWCFDGSNYRDEFGDVAAEHPLMEDITRRYLEREAARRRQRNAEEEHRAAEVVPIRFC
ncbi:unnamed protein product [Pedinophyceae sp. YPF-701]|nr:unnamed protein product [Pedinophyceae sp. YPF-701]